MTKKNGTIGALDTLVVADDDDFVLELLSTQMNLLGWNIIPSRSGEEAIQCVLNNQEKVAALITDLIMGNDGMAGLKVLRELRSKNWNGVAIMMSTSSSLSAVTQFMGPQENARGGDNFIEKPFDFDGVRSQILNLYIREGVRQQESRALVARNHELQASKEVFDAIMKASISPMIIISEEGKIESVNDSAVESLGWSTQEMIGKNITMIIPDPEIRKSHDGYIRNYINRRDAKVIGINGREVEVLRKNGSVFTCIMGVGEAFLPNGNRIFVGILTDITKQKNAERRLIEISKKDHLTGLFNRAALTEFSNEEFERSKRNNQPFSIIMLDLDHFKKLNDTHGHGIGDQVLVELGGILKDVIRSTDRAARYGGEEFMLLLPNTDSRDAVIVAEKLRRTIEEFSFASGSIRNTASLGVSTYHHQSDGTSTHGSIEELFKSVDLALYEAKASGRNCIRIK